MGGINRKRLEDELFPNKPVELPDDTKGRCKRCNKLSELGDGFCLLCWDKGSDKNKDYKQPKRKYKKKGKVGRPRKTSVPVILSLMGE